MADRIRFGVSLTPLETLTDENGGTRDIVASEVGRSLSGSGESIAISDYSNAANTQGFLNAAPNYRQASASEVGTQLTTLVPDFIYIKNTGYIYSSATALGASTSNCVMVAIEAAPNEIDRAGWATANLGEGLDHFIEIAWLKPGQAILLPLAASNLNITQFGTEAGDLSRIGDGSEQASGMIYIYVRTFTSTGGTAATNNAIEFLAVT